ncbi:MAG: thiamine pyrophosphokinase [Paracoccaceae bacterium]
MDEPTLALALSIAPRVVAADGGADAALAAGAEPEAVIGDMDSLSQAARVRLADRLHLIEDQDRHDFDKAWAAIASPLVMAVGFSGGRLDHTLAVLSTLRARPDRACVVLSAHSACAICPPLLRLDVPEGAGVSLHPLTPFRATSQGLAWPLDGIDFAPGGRGAGSNRATGPVTVRPDTPGALVIVAPNHAAALARAVTRQPPLPLDDP